MESTTARELQSLSDDLDRGRITPLRDRYPAGRLVRHPMIRYADHVWLFPFGVAPDLRRPVEIFRNGISQWMGHEVRLIKIGTTHPTTVAVFELPTHAEDVIQATYEVYPEVGR